MDAFINKLKIIIGDRALLKRILFVVFMLFVFRALAAIPIPGVDPLRLSQFLSGNQFLGLLNIFSGGGLATLSIVMLGVGPYITASIIMQLLTIMVPSLKQMYHEEGDLGRRKFTQYSRLITLPLALIQGFSLLVLLERQGIIEHLTLFSKVTNLIVITGGTVLLMWLGELISQYGIGNGVSLIIFAGIVSSLPSSVGQVLFTFDVSQIPLYLAFLVAGLLIVAGVVFVTEAERPLPVTYAKRVRGTKMFGGVSTYLPLRINQAGVIPIIFAIAIILLPTMVAQLFVNVKTALVAGAAQWILQLFENQLFYGIAYFVMVVAFTYFYTAVIFHPDQIAENLQKQGGFIPGIRPGSNTAHYLQKVVTRIVFTGALFLGVIAVLPLITAQITNTQSLVVGGTSLLIVVSVVIETVNQINAQLAMRDYEEI